MWIRFVASKFDCVGFQPGALMEQELEEEVYAFTEKEKDRASATTDMLPSWQAIIMAQNGEQA